MNNEQVKITPSKKISLEDPIKNNVPTEKQETCLFIFGEDGKWDATKELIKLGAVWDGSGWLIKNEHKDFVENFCKQTNMVCVDQPIPENFEELRYKNKSALFQQQISITEIDIKALTLNVGVQYREIEDLISLDEHRLKLENHKDGKKIISLINKYRSLKEKLTWIKNEKIIETIQNKKNPDDNHNTSQGQCDSIGNIIKDTGFLEKLNQKIGLGKIELSGLSTGFPKIDEIIDGLQNEHLITLAARTGMGKSFVALNLIANITIENKITTAFFSLEMSYNQILCRLIAFCSGISSQKVKKGQLIEEEFNSVIGSIANIGESPILISDNPINSILKNLLNNIENAVTKGAKFIVVDHIGLVNSGKPKENRANEVGEITRALKIAAKNFKIPIMIIAQLNRNADKDEYPKLSELRESGAIEQDSDIIIFIHRSEYYEANKNPQQVDLIIAKNRDGEQNKVVYLEYDKITWELKELEDNKKKETPKSKTNDNSQNHWIS